MARKKTQKIKTYLKYDKNDLLIFFKLDSDSINSEDVFLIIQGLNGFKNKEKLIILLNSSGGDIYSAYKIMTILRSKYKEIEIVVPYNANSAATLMTLAADNIIFGPHSEISPLDLPIEHPSIEGTRISALDGVRPLEYLAKIGTELAINTTGITIRQEIGLSRKDSVELALHFISEMFNPIMRKLEGPLINMCYRELDIATRYSEEFLNDYMFKDKNKQKEAKKIARRLVWNYPAHSFAIGIKEAENLGLNTKTSNEYKYWNQLFTEYLELKNNKCSVVKFIHQD